MSKSIFRTVVEAIDKATGPLKEVLTLVRQVAGAEHQAHTHGVADAAVHSRAFVALSGHVQLMRSHFGRLTTSVGEFGHSISEFLPMLAGLGAAGSLVGLVELAEHASEAFAELNKAAKTAGLSAEEFGALALAAKLVDVPVQTMSTGLFQLGRRMADVAAGKNKELAALFHHLHMAVRDANGQIRNAADVLPELAEAMSRTESAALRDRAAMALFGRAGRDLLPLLLEGRAGFEELAAAAREVQFVPQGDAAKQLEQFHQSWLLLGAAVQGFTTEIGTKLAPVLQPVLELAKQWVVANRDWIATNLAGAVGELAGWLQKLDLHRVTEEVRGWIVEIGHVVESLGGWHTILIAVTLAMGSPLLGAIASLITVIGGIGGAIQAVAAIMLANPIGLIITGIALSALAIYEYWTPIKVFFADLWAAMQATFERGMVGVRALIEDFRALPSVITEAWSVLGKFFDDLWNAIVAKFRWVQEQIQPVVNFLAGAVGSIENSWVGRQLGLSGGAASPSQAPAGGVGGPSAPAAPAPGPQSFVYPGGRAGGAPVLPGGPIPAGAPVLPPSPFAPGGPVAANQPTAAAGGPGAPGASGKTDVTITLKNAPPGTQVESRSSGNAQVSNTAVGYADPLALAF